ncbi:probable carboxylesterase 17 [Typha angustifolia]|uniref:probable carboxylesterase 17 n=1 Tax=Typha angustifolia TaxID=59011 RepID=UPI003C2DC717
MRRARMGALHVGDSRLNFHAGKSHGPVVEEIEGLIRFYKDGHVDRLPAIPDVPCAWALDADIACRDEVIDHSTGVWARIYMPKLQGKLPLLIYFHGGGFCVASAAWSCYHKFLIRLALLAKCIIVSVNYRLAPENRLPAAYNDGLTVLRWLRQQASCSNSDGHAWWRNHSNFSRVFLGGDSAGATIAFNVATQVVLGATEPQVLKPVCLRGVILIQPFFGAESRTSSEKYLAQSSRSALTLATSDCYWRMALPTGSNRDHPWCNPMAKASPKLEDLRLPPVFVCISEMDILRDRNLEFCKAMKRAGKSVEQATYAGVGHAFQILHNYHLSQARTHEMLTHINVFITNR